jgi:hypothetical protein
MSLQMDDGTIRKNGNYKEFTKLTKKYNTSPLR